MINKARVFLFAKQMAQTDEVRTLAWLATCNIRKNKSVSVYWLNWERDNVGKEGYNRNNEEWLKDDLLALKSVGLASCDSDGEWEITDLGWTVLKSAESETK